MKGAISWLLLDKVLRVVSGVLVSTAVARYLGPADYGTLAVAIGMVGIASAAANMGADHINLAELSRRPGAEFLASAFAARLLWATLCTLLVTALAFVWAPDQLVLYAVLSGMVLVTAPSVFTHQLYAHDGFRTATLFGMVAIVLAVCARLAGVAWHMNLVWFAGCAVLEMAVLVVAAGVWAWRRDLWQPRAASMPAGWRYLRLCLPTIASAVLVAAYFRAELLVVNAVMGELAAGTWSAALMFILPWNMASAAILPVVNRRLGQAGSHDAVAQRHLMVRLVRAMLLLAVGCVLVNVLAIQFAVPLLLGPRFAASAPVAMICSLALVPLFLGAVQDVWLAQQRRNSVVLRKVLIGLPLSVGLLWVGISQAGLIGAAIGMVASHWATAIVLNAWLDRDFLKIQMAAVGFKSTNHS
jgi:O-antigen/teichoic acid export membrane protein